MIFLNLKSAIHMKNVWMESEATEKEVNFLQDIHRNELQSELQAQSSWWQQSSIVTQQWW